MDNETREQIDLLLSQCASYDIMYELMVKKATEFYPELSAKLLADIQKKKKG